MKRFTDLELLKIHEIIWGTWSDSPDDKILNSVMEKVRINLKEEGITKEMIEDEIREKL